MTERLSPHVDTPGAVPRPRRRPRRTRLVLIGVAAAGVIGLAASTAMARTSSGPDYRSTTVVRAAVRQQLHASGTVEPVSQASVSFPTSGTVASVAVSDGDRVSTGQVLATLDATSLQATLDQRNASLAQAELTLAQAEAGQSSTAGASSTGGSGSGGSGSASVASGASSGSSSPSTTSAPTTTAATSTNRSGGSSSVGGSTAAALAAAQPTVLADQQQLDRDLATAQADLVAARSACTSTSSTPGSSGTSTTVATEGTNGACLTAQQQLLVDQTAVADIEASLAQAESALNALLGTAASGSTSASTSSTPSSSSTSSSTPSSSTASTSTTPSAQELVADQAAVDAAATQVAVAQQGLDQARIVSPINGTVVAVALAAGDSVSADSSTQTVTVAGPGGYEVATTVSVSHRAKLELGDPATVAADGSTTVLTGKVVAIGVAGTTSGTSTTYPVVIGFATTPAGLRDGASASVTIDLASVEAATAVASSAIHTSGTTHTVIVLDGTTSRSVKVKTGVVGADLTQITSGLRPGQKVVLADLSQALPTSDSSSTTRRSGLTGSGLTTGLSGSGSGFGGGTGGPPTGGPP